MGRWSAQGRPGAWRRAAPRSPGGSRRRAWWESVRVSQQDPRIAQRYAAQPSPWPKTFFAVGLLLVVALAGWILWAVWIHSTPQVSSTLVTWEVVDDHTATASVQIDLQSDAKNPNCLLRAYAADHTVVGDASFVPEDGRNEVTIRTERLATSVEKIGCTANGQNDTR
jgi:hypothetical protein